MLAGIGLAGIAFGLSVAGLNLLPWSVVAALVGVGSISMTLYVIHARRTGSPVLDFSLLRLPTLRAAIIGGFMFRLGIGALPFLLPLMMQVGFGLSPFQSGPRDLRLRGRRDGHEDAGRAHHPHLRLPQHDDGQCA